MMTPRTGSAFLGLSLALLMQFCWLRVSDAARIHAACSRCKKTFVLSEEGYGFARNWVGVCGQCADPKNFETPQDRTEQEGDGSTDESPDKNSSDEAKEDAEKIKNFLDSINPAGQPIPPPKAPEGSNQKRNDNTKRQDGDTQGKENAEKIKKDLDEINPRGRPSPPPGTQEGANPKRHEDTKWKTSVDDSYNQVIEDLNELTDYLNKDKEPTPPGRKGDNSPRQRGR